MADFSEIRKRLMAARQKDMGAQEMGEEASPTALGAVAEYGADKAGERLDEMGAQQKTIASQAWDRLANPYGPQLPEHTPEEIARASDLVAGSMGTIAPEARVLPNKPVGEFGSSLMKKEADSKALRDAMYETLPDMSPKNLLKQQFANQAANRAMDQADRARKFNSLRSKMTK